MNPHRGGGGGSCWIHLRVTLGVHAQKPTFSHYLPQLLSNQTLPLTGHLSSLKTTPTEGTKSATARSGQASRYKSPGSHCPSLPHARGCLKMAFSLNRRMAFNKQVSTEPTPSPHHQHQEPPPPPSPVQIQRGTWSLCVSRGNNRLKSGSLRI